MITTQSEKMADDKTQKQRLGKDYSLFSFNLKILVMIGIGMIATAVFPLPLAFAKPSNRCSETQYWLKYKNGSTSCVDCSPCLPGQSLSIKCGNSKPIPQDTLNSVICQPCPKGVSFSSKYDTSICTPCSMCSADQVVERNCTSERDIKCSKECASKDRYYDDAKGVCLHCSNCCGDDKDVIESECKDKLGADSNMICSFDSSLNRCDKSTAFTQKPATITFYTSSNQGAKHKQIVVPSRLPGHYPSQRKDQDERSEPPTAQSSPLPSEKKHWDVWAAVAVPIAIVGVMLSCGCVYFFKARRIDTSVWCKDGPRKKLAKTDEFYEVQLKALSPESRELLLKEGNPDSLACSYQIDSKKDSKLLSSLLQSEPHLRKICECLDTPMPGVGHYRAIASYYGINYYKMVSVFEKESGGPSRALIEYLAATEVQLTVAEFVSVVKREAERDDVAQLLEQYDLQ